MKDIELRELEESIGPIWEIACKFGLDPFPVHFELVPPAIMYEFGSYGLPGRFSHWSHGKVYHRMKTQYDYGLSKIYELVINTNPSYAFLMEGNSLLQQKLVAAHVFGHTDFFKNNAYFQHTNRRMVETASLNAGRIRRYEQEHGLRKVEHFLDSVLSIQEHIDPHVRFAKFAPEPDEQEEIQRDPASDFEDLFNLTPDNESANAKAKASREKPSQVKVPEQPEKDVVGFIMEHSRHLEPWQRDVMGIVREEMLYFVPQMQTKVLNEGWACATGDSLVLTEKGLVRFDELYGARDHERVAAGAANELRQITDYHKEALVPTIRIRTKRGLAIEGAHKHRVLMADGSWAYLRDVKTGDRIAIASGTNIWPAEEQRLAYVPRQASPTLARVADLAGVSSWTVIRHMKGRRTERADAIDGALRTVAYRTGMSGRVLPTRSALRLPATLNEELAWLLGYFTGDGNRTKSGICFTTGDTELVGRLSAAISRALGLRASIDWDPTETGGRWRVVVHSRELLEWLGSIGINIRDKARQKKIPAVVRRSPKNAMSAFLRGYFDADGYAGDAGVILSSASKSLVETVQVVLLNYGILSSQRRQKDGCIQLAIRGESAAGFLAEIGFTLGRKQQGLESYVRNHRWFKNEDASDAVVAVEQGIADVYDITVEGKHSYVANGLANHNSFWHARIMRELDLTDSEFTDYATMNAGVIAPSRQHINPYYLGVKILEDIERRWDSPTEEEQRALRRTEGQGRKKLFEVRELENDVSLIRNYLTRKLVEDLDLYLYERQGDEWVIVDKNWENVRDSIVARMANFGNPTILVEDGDYHHNGELLLSHLYDGQELDATYAEKTLEHVFHLWGRSVHLKTRLEDEETIFTYDGSKHKREPE